MKINILRKMRYQNTFIYILQMEYVFMYLFSLNGEIYQDHATIKPSLINRLKYKLGFIKSPYTADDLSEGEKVVLSGAMESLDKAISEGVITRQGRKRKEREIEKIQEDIKSRSEKSCMWQALESDDGFYYSCLTHGMAVKMQDGEKPVHDSLSPFVEANHG